MSTFAPLAGCTPKDGAYLRRRGEQFGQRSLGLNLAILQDDNMIRPLQGGATVRDGQAGDVAQLRKALLLPQRLFYLNVEGTGEIINDDQVCIPRKHPRCRSTLYLSPGELDTTWANLPGALD